MLGGLSVSTKQSSILAASVLVTVSYLFLDLVSGNFLTARLVPFSAQYFGVGGVLLVDG